MINALENYQVQAEKAKIDFYRAAEQAAFCIKHVAQELLQRLQDGKFDLNKRSY